MLTLKHFPLLTTLRICACGAVARVTVLYVQMCEVVVCVALKVHRLFSFTSNLAFVRLG